MAKLSEDDRANLVAYLDGELDETVAQALESKLTLDPQARAEAEALRRTWELLDYLPKPEPSPDFTHRTLSRLAVKPLTGKMAAVKVGLRRGWQRLLPLWWAAAVLLAAGGGYGAAQWLWPPRPVPIEETSVDLDETLVRHLRVIENKPLLDVVEDLDFLRALDQPDMFSGDSES
jgi:hypothetical protein